MDSLNLNREIWLPIIGFEKSYSVSSFGRIKRNEHITYIKRNRYQKTDSKRVLKEKIMSFSLDEDGFSLICLKSKTYRVSRIVAENFLIKPEKATRVRHKNNVRTDDRVENLYWGKKKTKEELHQYNVIYSRKNNKTAKRIAWGKKAKSLPKYLAYIRNPERRYVSGKKQAIKRKKEFELNLEDYLIIINNPCFYCKKDISVETGIGLDRIDNKKGYFKENVLPCCGNCNKIRTNRLTSVEMTIAMNAILDFRKNGDSSGLVPVYNKKEKI